MQLNTTMQQGDKLGQCLIRKTWFVTWSLRLKQYMCPSAIALKCYYICWSWLCVCYIIHVHVLHKNWVDSAVVSKVGRPPPLNFTLANNNNVSGPLLFTINTIYNTDTFLKNRGRLQ